MDRCLLDECANTTRTGAAASLSEDRCYRYKKNTENTEYMCRPHYTHEVVDADLLEKCERWIYDTSVFQSTIVTEFNLTCDNEWKQTMISTVYMVGMFFGAIILGNAADVIGRKLAFTLNCLAMACVMTASAFAPDLMTFGILRFFCGVTGVAHFLIIFVWAVEAVGKEYRTSVGFLYSVVFSLGSSFMGLVAYYIRDWRTLQLVISLPIFLPVLLFWVLPESTRWLITKKRFDEARELIIEAAKMNGKHVPEHLLIKPIVDEQNVKPIVMTTVGHVVDEKNKIQPENIVGIFRTPVLCRRLCVMFTAWVAAVMSYYGITYSTSNLSGNFFINYEMTMVVEIPACIFGGYLMGVVGRRITVCGSLLIGGLACLATGLVPADPTMYRVVCSMIGKFFTSFILGCVYAYTSELFPTNSRSAAVGLCSTFGRIGGILAPIVADLGRRTGPTVPFIIFAVVNIIVGFICLVLPETNNLPLPSTIQEAKNMSSNCSGGLRALNCCKSDSRNMNTA